MEQFGKIKAANFYRGCYLTDDIPGVWMHKDFSSVSLFYEIFINGHKQIPEEATEYIMDFVDNIFPRTVLSFEDIKVSVVSYAPVSENGNERSNAFVYGICIENLSTRQINGTARIFKEIAPEEELFGNEVSILQGSGREKSEFTLNPLEKIWIPSVIYAPGRYEEAESIRLNSEYWFDQTHSYFRNIIGRLIVEKNPVEGALFERSVMQCFNAIAMNAEGEVVGSNWGSFPATRQIWMKDMYYAFLPFCLLEPDLAWKGAEWFVHYGVRPKGDKCEGGVTHSLGNSLAGILLAGIIFESTGKADFLKNKPEMFSKMNQIMDEVEHVENAEDSLYPSIWISDALALGKYHTGSNICVWKAFQSMAEIYGYVFHDGKKQAYYAEKAKKLKAAIEDKMTVMVDGKRQYLEGIGGVEESQKRWISEENYKKPFLDTALIFLQDVIRDKKINLLMHDGEESDTTLMPFYGYCDYFDESYRNFVDTDPFGDGKTARWAVNEVRGRVGMPGQIVPDPPAGNVVGRGDFAESGFPAMPHHAMPIGRAGIKIKLSPAESFLYSADDFIRVGGMDIPRAVIEDGFFRIIRFVRQGNEITAEGHVVIRQIDTDIRRLQRGAAGVAFPRVISHHGEVGHVAAGGHSLLHGADHADFPLRGETVHRRLVGRFHRRAAIQRGAGHIRHAVA